MEKEICEHKENPLTCEQCHQPKNEQKVPEIIKSFRENYETLEQYVDGEGIDPIFRYYRLDFPQGDSRSIEQFISEEIQDAYDRGSEEATTYCNSVFGKELKKAREEMNKQLEDTLKEIANYDVSAWRKVGKERGYWDYFKQEVEREVRTELINKVKKLRKWDISGGQLIGNPLDGYKRLLSEKDEMYNNILKDLLTLLK